MYFVVFVVFGSGATMAGVPGIYSRGLPFDSIDKCHKAAEHQNSIDTDVNSNWGRQWKAEWVCLEVRRREI